MKINYLTTNKLKFEIAKQFFNSVDEYELVQHSFSVPEMQEETCEEVARQSAICAAMELGEPCVVMDVGFSINALNGFPGPFVKYINEWLSEYRLLRMLDESDDRTAYFTDALAVGFPDGTVKVFSHRIMGRMAKEGEYQSSKWPANSLFIPDGHSIPLGSLSTQEQTDFWQSENENWQKLTEYLSEKA
jgi:non-canonical purine NTP pyrophosphatase (RdgB/HAM1 family)